MSAAEVLITLALFAAQALGFVALVSIADRRDRGAS